MIFGYISKKEYSLLENYLEECNPRGTTFRYRCGEKKAYFFRGDMDRSLSPIFYGSNSLMLCEGIPIRGSPENGYELVDIIDDEDIRKGFHNFVGEIVSNVSMIFFKNGNDPKLYLSSNRAAAGRIYYRYINEGIAFSSSFSVLLHFGPSRINYEAIYSILKYGSVPPPLTLSKDVYVVPPSHYVKINVLSERELFHQPYFRFCFSQERSFNLNRLDKTLNAISEILSQMNGCLLLSGGVDSSLLAHKLGERSSGMRAHFLAFGKNDPELTFATETSTSSDCQLNVVYMDESRLCETIDEIAFSYDHPFNDMSVIPTYYLIKSIANKGEKIIVEGTGGDGCFGFETIASDKVWIFMYSLPKLFKRFISSIYSYLGIWKKEGLLEKIFRTIAKCSEIDANLGPLTLSPPNDVFSSNSDHNETLGRLFTSLINNLINPCSSEQIFKQKATVTSIMFGGGARATAKTHFRNKSPKVHTIYPFLWKDILEEQGRISWAAKVNSGIVKWPLKKLLESYMPHQFIYRKKYARGFDPDLESYIKNQRVYSLLKETLINPKIAGTLINKNRLVKLVERLPTIEHYSFPLCSHLWGLLFIDLWASKNHKLILM